MIALGVGAGDPKRRWPVERFAALGSCLTRAYGARLVVLGGPGEEALGRSLSDALGAAAIDLVGRTTLAQAGAVLARASLFIGNDTGIMHLAAGAGTPIVEISCHPRSAPAGHGHSPQRFGPWGVEHRVLQPDAPLPPCVTSCTAEAAHCIELVDVAEAAAAAAELLGAPARTAAELESAMPLQSNAR